jgi:hypothetical protein
VDLVDLARMHWELFLVAREQPRDWQSELDDDAAHNEVQFAQRQRAHDDDAV